METPATYAPRRLLLDTHTWLWWQSRDRRLGRAARRLVSSADDVRFSAASAWEIAIKSAIGKLEVPAGSSISRELELDGFTQLPVTIAHADAVRQLPPLHRDPFDRMLVAQALVEGLTIVTADEALRAYGVAVVDATT
ncbi:MAG: type II toxin-antitoxin system VapC family toxin [Gemmatimonadaceae bacterium]|nr:type II toxin-antitoxin system VapC family toxin [Gemmatimonadaceae bacterium]